jgi:hypothetical protein
MKGLYPESGPKDRFSRSRRTRIEDIPVWKDGFHKNVKSNGTASCARCGRSFTDDERIAMYVNEEGVRRYYCHKDLRKDGLCEDKYAGITKRRQARNAARRDRRTP